MLLLYFFLVTLDVTEGWKSNHRVFVLEYLAVFHWGIKMGGLNSLSSRWHSWSSDPGVHRWMTVPLHWLQTITESMPPMSYTLFGISQHNLFPASQLWLTITDQQAIQVRMKSLCVLPCKLWEQKGGFLKRKSRQMISV